MSSDDSVVFAKAAVGILIGETWESPSERSGGQASRTSKSLANMEPDGRFDVIVLDSTSAEDSQTPLPRNSIDTWRLCTLWMMILSFITATLVCLLILAFTMEFFQVGARHGTNTDVSTQTDGYDREGYYLGLLDLVERSVALEPGSAQAEALEWMAFEDVPLEIGGELDRFWQRFALTVWYFNQGGPTLWKFFNMDDSAGWMEHGSGVHECDWKGIDCNRSDQVIGIRLAGGGSGILMTGTSLSTELGVLTNLEHLDISDHRLQGSIPDEWKVLTNLRTLSLSRNMLGSSVSPWIGELKELKHLFLDSNRFTGSLPDSLNGLTNLRTLQLQTNPFLRGVLDSFMPQLPALESLDVSGTYIGGSIPESSNSTLEFGKMLKNFRAYNLPLLEGTIPPTIATNSPMLQELIIGEVPNMNGVIPTELGLLSGLEVLAITFAGDITGTLATELGQLTSLLSLDLKGTNHFGSLPQSYSQLTKLTLLDLRDNNGITGTLPTEYGQMTALKFLYLSGTDLSGAVGPEICGLSLDRLEADCKRGIELLCDCCTGCWYSP